MMSKYEVLQVRRMLAEQELVEKVSIRINELNMLYIQNMDSIEKTAQRIEDYELLTSALWDAYSHEIDVLKQMCIQHGVSKSNMFKLFVA